MNNPIVSIIIATYNSEKTLRIALESVTVQEFQDWECIVVDGASKDRTIEIVKEFEARDSRFRHISEPDNGIFDAFNKGWELAKGEWIYYLGSDDTISRLGIKDLLKENLSVDVLYGDLKILYPSGKTKIQKQSTPSLHPLKFPSHQSAITRKSCLKRLEGFDTNYSIIADKEFFIRVIENGGVFYKVSTIVASFTLGGASSSITKMLIENFKLGKSHKLGVLFYKKLIIGYSKRYLRYILLKLGLYKD